MIIRRIRYWLRSGDRARGLGEEIAFHIDMRARELVEQGMSETEARGRARKEFGNVTRTQEESRATWIARWWSDLLQDLAFSARTLRKQPAFAGAAMLSAALGIGACSMIFGIANYALFRPLPVAQPWRLMSVSISHPKSGAGDTMSYPEYRDLKQSRSFDGVAAFFPFMAATISSAGEPQRYWGSLVTANYFDVVRPRFALGRGFEPRDDTPGHAPAIVLSHQLWKSRFHADPAIVGKTIEFNQRAVTVVGVTGPLFRGTEISLVSDFWTPFSMRRDVEQMSLGGDRMESRTGDWLLTAARLRDGAAEREAAAEVEVLAQRWRADFAEKKLDGLHLERAGQVNPGLRKVVMVFFGLVLAVCVLVLLTACANVANLLLARAAARRKEVATRLAIGAGRGRLVRQLLTESVLLSLLGGAGGYAIAYAGASSIGKFKLPFALPIDFSVALDYRVLLFCVGLSLVTGIVFGLAPALRASRLELTAALKQEQVRLGGSRTFGLRNLLVVAQVAICAVLLISSGLFLRSLYATHTTDTGFAHRDILLLAFDPALNRYSEAETRTLLAKLLERPATVPGVEAAAITSMAPLSIGGNSTGIVPDDKLADKENSRVRTDLYAITPRFFDALGISLMDGEVFRELMPAGDVVVVNAALAAKAFPQQRAVGRKLELHGRMRRVIGIVATAKSRTIGEDPRPALYVPLLKEQAEVQSMVGLTMMVRTKGNPAAFAHRLRETVREVDPALAVFDVRTMEQHLTNALLLPRAAAFLFGVAGLMGLAIATIGIYGVISFTVAQQTREIGIRMALGARRGQVLGMVVRQGMGLTATGVAFGIAASLGVSRAASSLLYGISPTDPITFLATPAFLMIVAIVACLAPARRAASLDPVGTLRCE